MIDHVTPADGNVFADLGFEPGEAENLKIRADLMIQLREYIRTEGLTQEAAATLFGVSQPRISDIVRGKIENFSIDALVVMLARAGMHLKIELEHAA